MIEFSTMRNGPFFHSDAVSLTLASSRSREAAEPDLVWQFQLEDSNPIELRSNLSLQAQAFSLFPVIQVGDHQIIELSDFFAAPRIDSLLPNYLELVGSPTEGIRLCLEYLAETPQTLLGRVSLQNLQDTRQEISFTLYAKLAPMGDFPPLSSTRVGTHTILKAQTGALTLSISLDTAARAVLSPLQGLRSRIILEAGQTSSFLWRLQAHTEAAQLARGLEQPLPANWDAMLSRQRMEAQSQTVQFVCEDPDWQLVFDSVQRQAAQLLNDDGKALRYYRMRNATQSLLAEREPNPRSMGAAKAEALDLYQLCLCLLPARPLDCERLLDTYLPVLALEDTTKTNLPFPVLASLAWRVFKHTQNPKFIQRHFESLRNSCFAWFEKSHDQDLDGLPEWADPAQTGLENYPDFDLLNTNAFPSLLSNLESRGLSALLETELEAVGLMAHMLKDSPSEAMAHGFRNRLAASLEEWMSSDPQQGYRHALTHHHSEGKLLYQGKFSGELNLEAPIKPANQVCGQLNAAGFWQKPLTLKLTGKNAEGEVLQETISRDQIRWLPGLFFFQTSAVFSELYSFSAEPGSQEIQLRLYTPSCNAADITQLLTLLPSEEETSLDEVLNSQLAFQVKGSAYGVAEKLRDEIPPNDEVINLAWNALLIEALIQNDHKALAGELFTRLVSPVKNSLKRSHRNFEFFQANNGRGRGNQNHVKGLLPLDLLLDIAGIRILSAEKISLTGKSCLPWPFTLRFQGLEVTKDGKNTKIVFADGSEFFHYGTGAKTFSKPTQ